MKTFDETVAALKPLAKRYRQTSLSTAPGVVWLKLPDTNIVEVQEQSGLIRLHTGGFHTVTTKKRINEALHALGADFQVFQRAFEWYTWNWRTHEERDFMDGQYYRSDGHAA